MQVVFKSVLNKAKLASLTSITLLNNAGSLGQIKKLENIDYQSIINSVNINYTAPLLMNSLFIKETESWGVDRKIRTISSGAANSDIDGWSVYCSTKAGVNRMTSIIGLEQKNKKNTVHVIAIYPGIVDTAMQMEIRNASEEDFSNVKRFKVMKANNELTSPEEVAIKILVIENNSSIKNGSIVDVRDY